MYIQDEIELSKLDASYGANLSTTSLNPPDSVLDSPPPYSPSTTFIPVAEVQIETVGKPLWSRPLTYNRRPVLVYAVAADGSLEEQPLYISKRPAGSSGSSCFLVAADDVDETPLSATTYRFGPGRHPQVRLAGDSTTIDVETIDAASNPESENQTMEDSFQILPRGLLTRAQRFHTRLGTFEWRYASRKERKALGADSLLILDRITKVFHSQDGSHGAKTEEVRTPVAHFVRNSEFRTVGSKGCSAGNGGRLQLDLRPWGDTKTEGEMVRVLAITTCLTMLKKEMDRLNMHQMAAVSTFIGAAAA